MARINRTLKSALLAADGDLATLTSIPVGDEGYVALQVLIDNGAGIAPTDTPLGVWELYATADGGGRYTLVSGTTITTELAKVAPSGNTLVDAWAILVGVPGSAFKLRYKRTSGGATSARALVNVSSW